MAFDETWELEAVGSGEWATLAVLGEAKGPEGTTGLAINRNMQLRVVMVSFWPVIVEADHWAWISDSEDWPYKRSHSTHMQAMRVKMLLNRKRESAVSWDTKFSNVSEGGFSYWT